MTGPTGPAGRPAGAPPTSLVDRLAAGDERAALTFAGQGVAWLGELSALVADRPELRPLLDEATATLVDEAGSPEGLASGRYRHGFDVAAWVTDRGNVPDDAYLRSAAVSYPGILLAQLLLWQVVRTDGLERAGHGIVAAAGHSQGLLAALAVAEAPFGRVDDGRIDRHLRFAARLGRALAATAPGPATGPDGEPVSPMAAVRGVREDRLAALVAEVNDSSPERLAVSIALRNAGDRFVLSGPPEGLLLVRAALDRTAAAEEDQRRRGRRGGSPLRFGWSALDVEVPFHLAGASAEAAADAAAGELAAAGLLPSGADLAVAVVDPAGERDLRHEPDLAGTVVRSQFCNPVRWDATVRRLVEAGAGWVLDLGPGTDVAHLSTAAVRGSGARVLALASPEGRRVLATPGVAAREPDLRYADLAPGVVELPDGTRHLDNRHTRVAGRPPILLAGMTPTTADAGIVAAAANAGWHAELAGGGQPTTEALATRLEELDEQLAPGAEVVFNTLYLDRHLWDLHWERDGLILDARRQGSALRGLTVSAGIPDVDEAVAIARRLLDAGMPYVAFKPGTVDQIRQVGAIADALAPHPVFAQVEGGKAGGHHSWEDLDDLLLATYHDLRRRPNVVLCVGGGVAAPDRAADLLTGTWALAHGEPPMPVDGVLLGTVAMACAEATASPQVKAALVAAAGTADWVPRRGSGGGVTSGRSNLNADVHCLDNHAAQVAHLLEEVAGDPAAVAARADELVAALARTAKPYFGDLRAMTYLEVLERLVELMATGRHRRLDDGAWGDPTWRRRALEVFRRFAARLSPVDEGPVEVPVATPGDLDDPAAALAAFTRAHPRAATTLLHPADVDAVLASCDGPGKPVPFVPVLDGEIRRWYMADALWQAQDDRLDADAVLVIPGPEAVAGIERADEPVADLLARFEAAVLERLERAGTPVVPRDRLATTGLAPRHLARAVQGADGPVAGLLVASSVADEEGRSRPNPLWRWIDAGDRIESEVDEAGRLVALTARPWDRPAESVRVAADPDDEAVVVVASDAGDGDPPLRVRYRATAGPGGSGPTFSELDGPQARRDHTRAVLLGDDAASVGGTSLRARSWTCPPGWAGAYAATVGAPADTPLLGLAFSLAWPSLADLLLASPVADAFERVVHHELDVTPGPAWPPQPGEDGEVVATVVAARDEGSTQAVRCRAELRSARGRLAVVEATLRVLAPAGRLPWVEERRDRLRLALDAGDRAALDLLADQPWWHPVPGAATHDGSGTATAHGDDAGAGADRGAHGSEGAPSREGDAPDTTSDGGATADRGAVGTVEVDVSIGLTRAVPGGPARVTATGLARVAGQVVAEIRLDEVAEVRDHPVQAALDLVGRPAPERRPRPRRRTAGATDVAPVSLDGFAAVSGDRNPLHRSVLAARRAGRRGPVVHGMWTASRAEALVVDALCDGDPSRLARWAVTCTAPVEPGDE
ncbi:MAG: fatty acid synthase subunit beta domain-containing protein, partial [Acidimicrobiia bacterium]